MASNSGFTDQLPSNTSSVALGDDEFRSVKSFMFNWWEQEHYGLDGSSTSAGVHKEGFARIYSQSAAPTAILPKGQLWHDSDNESLFVATAAGTGSWLTLVDGSIGTVAPARNYLYFSDLDIASTVSALADRFGDVAGHEHGVDYAPQIRSGAITGISASFGANITSGSCSVSPSVNRVVSGYSVGLNSSSASHNVSGLAGHSVESTTGVSTLTFAAGDWISCYVSAAAMSPDGTGDFTEIQIEVTYID